MKQFTGFLMIVGSVAVLIGAASGTASIAIAGWIIAVLSLLRYLEYRDKERRAEREARILRQQHENDLDTYQFSVKLTREQLLRDHDKIKL